MVSNVIYKFRQNNGCYELGSGCESKVRWLFVFCFVVIRSLGELD
jgi:hypothetical protein